MMGEGQGDPMRGFFSWRVHVISRDPFTKTKWLLRLTAQLHSSYRSMRKLHIGLLMASLFLHSFSLFADEVELRISTFVGDGSAEAKVLEKMAANVRDRTEGRVSVKFFHSGVMGDERDVVSKMKLGQLDGAILTSAGLSRIDDSANILETPGLFASTSELDYTADKIWPAVRTKFLAKGYKLLGRGEIGSVHIVSKTPVTTLAELQALKMCTFSDDLPFRSLLTRFGMSGVPLGVPEVASSLTSGRITGCYAAPGQTVALRWHEQIKYMTSVRIRYAITATVLNKTVYEKLSVSDRKIFDDESVDASKKLRSHARKEEKQARTVLERKGVTISETPAALVREFESKMLQVQSDLSGKAYNASDLATVRKHRDEYRAKGSKPSHE